MQAGLRLCCSRTPKTGFLASRPIYKPLKGDIAKFKCFCHLLKYLMLLSPAEIFEASLTNSVDLDWTAPDLIWVHTVYWLT